MNIKIHSRSQPMLWKNHFYFTKSQRTGLWVLIIALILGTIIDSYIHFCYNKEVVVNKNTKFLYEANNFRASLHKNTKHTFFDKSWQDLNAKVPDLFKFNPNTLDSNGFISLGINSNITKHILNYRRKGGEFTKTSDFAKIYGLSQEQFDILKPYINIPPKKLKTSPTFKIELNRSDTSQLKQIKNISPWIARRIVAYRQSLGGYISVNQLTEVWGINPELFKKIKQNFTVDISQINKIQVNEAGINDFRKHPYFNFSQAKTIYEYRKKNGTIKSFDDLKKINKEKITADFLEKIKPYLSF